jgi:hypothetical protein
MLNQLNFKHEKYDFLPLIIILAGVLFSFYLQSHTPDGLFFSGDGGIKFLLAQQLSFGELRFDLNLKAEAWITQLWQQGFYPFKSPFVYEILDKHYITFPFTFPLVSAPFYKLFGFKGLYILPLVSTWLIWGTTYILCRRLSINKFITSAVLIALIFASPLTIYSGIFWEHSLAIALAFAGIAILLGRNFADLSNLTLIVSGGLIGLSVWFREELLCLVLAIFLLSAGYTAVNFRQENFKLTKILIFLASLLLTVFLFFGLNTLIYGHPLGAHSFQVVEGSSLIVRLRSGLENFERLSSRFIYHYPLVLLCPIYLLLGLFSRQIKLTNEAKILFLICSVFAVTLPFILPAAEGISLDSRTGGKQWGPRFLLILVPAISLLAAIGMKAIVESKNLYLKYGSIAIFSTLIVTGIQLNVGAGTNFLASSQQALPLLEQLQKQPQSVVATSHQYVNQSLSTLFGQKAFFLAETSEELEKFSTSLYQKGHKEFLYVCYPHRKCEPADELLNREKVNLKNDSHILQVSNLGTFGKYPLYEVSVRAN